MISSTVRLVASRVSARSFSSMIATGSLRITAAATFRSTSSQLLLQHQRQAAAGNVVSFGLRHLSTTPIFLDVGEVTDRILTVVKNFDQVDPAKVKVETKFTEDLGLDSLDIVEIVMAIEDEFAIEIPDQEADRITSIAQAIEYISTHPMAK